MVEGSGGFRGFSVVSPARNYGSFRLNQENRRYLQMTKIDIEDEKYSNIRNINHAVKSSRILRAPRYLL